MPEIAVKDINNKAAGTITLPDELFGITEKDALIHAAVVNYMANQRQGTHSTKTRGMVSGGGKKPWKQKGTGRARAGSSRSPLWRGGAILFGPSPRDYSYAMPKAARRQALYAALSVKIKDGEVVVLDKIEFEKPRTKQMVSALSALGVSGGSVLLVTEQLDANVALSARNIPAVNIRVASDLNVYDIVSHRAVLITKAALEFLRNKVELS